MSDQTYLIVKLLASVVCLLLALIPAFIGKSKGYRFITYYFLGVASFILALILALAVRPRAERSLEEEDLPSFRPGQAAVYLTVIFAALYTVSFLYTLFFRLGLSQAMASGAAANLLITVLPKRLPPALAMWALAGGLLSALNTRTKRRGLVITLMMLTAFAVVNLTVNLSTCLYTYSDGIDVYYLMPFTVGLYLLALVFALYDADRPVCITAITAGIVCAVLYLVLFVMLIAQRLSGRVLLSMLYDGSLLWVSGVISALAAILSGVPKKTARRMEFAAAAGAPSPQTVVPAYGAPPVVPVQPAIPEVHAQTEEAVSETAEPPAMVVFAAESANAAAMAMFGNTQHYYTPGYCISRVRANFHLPESARIEYVARANWDGPVPEIAGDQFQIDLPQVQRLQTAYLTRQLGLSEDAAAAAVGKAQAMQAPRLGLLWLCVPISPLDAE